MILAWIILFVIIVFAFIDIKKIIIIWMPLQLLFNAQVAIRYESPAMSLVIAVDFVLILFFYFGIGRKNLFINKRRFILQPVFVASIVSFTLSLLFSSMLSLQGVTSMVKYFATSFVLLAIFQQVVVTKTDIRLFVKSVFVIALLITSLGLFESVFKDNPILDYVYYNSPQNETTKGRMFYIPPGIGGGLSSRYGMVRAFSFFGIHIQFGVVCAFMLFFFGVLLKNKWLFIKQYNLILIIVLLLGGVLMANSKTAYFGILIFAFGLFSYKQLFNWKIVLTITLIVTVIIIYFPQYILNYTSLFDENIAEEGGGSSLALRLQQFAIATKMFMMNPLFGNGLGSIDVLNKLSAYSGILGAESAWMEILPERGIVGALVYIYTFIYLYKILKIDMPKRIVISFLLSILVMETATGLLDMVYYIPYLIVLRQMFILKKKEETRICNG